MGTKRVHGIHVWRNIYDVRNGTHIIDLKQELLEDALGVLSDSSEREYFDSRTKGQAASDNKGGRGKWNVLHK